MQKISTKKPSATVIYVDESPALVKSAVYILAQEGYELYFQDSQKASVLLSDHQMDVDVQDRLIFDLLGVIRYVKTECCSEVPIVLLTS